MKTPLVLLAAGTTAFAISITNTPTLDGTTMAGDAIAH